MHNETTNRTKIRNLKGQPYEPVLHPDPILAREGISITFLERFLDKVEFSETCILWKAGFTPRMLRGKRKGGNIDSRRGSWLIYNGEIPDGFYLMNLCPFGHRNCIHPNHISYARRHGQRPEIIDHQPLTSAQLERMETLCKQAGQSKDDIMRRLLATYKTPDWMLALGFSETFATRFWSKVNKTDGCWIWNGGKSEDGYGSIGIGNDGTGAIRAHRASWMMNHGRIIPKDKSVLHGCPVKHNKACVNPAHLRLGTCRENTLDATFESLRERGTHWNSKLTREQIQEVRNIFSKGGITMAALGRKFGIRPNHISRIIKGFVHSNSPYFRLKISGVEVPITCTGNTIILPMCLRL